MKRSRQSRKTSKALPAKVAEKGAGLTPEERVERAALIKEFRATTGWSAEQLASKLGVHKTAVYAFERSLYLPAPETYIKLSNLAVGEDWKFTESFLDWAGVDARTRDQLGDRTLAKQTAREVTTALRPLNSFDPLESAATGLGVGKVPTIPTAFLQSANSARYLRLPRGEFLPFREGDIVVVDTSRCDPVKMADGDPIVAWIGGSSFSGEGSLYIGCLRIERNVRSGAAFYFLRSFSDPRTVWIGASGDGWPTPEEIHILGKIVAWFVPNPRVAKEAR